VSPLKIVALRGTVVLLLFFSVGVLMSFRFYAVGSAAMEDTLLPGDRILVDKIGVVLGREPKFGDIVVMRYPLNPKEVWVKRIVAVPGDRLRIVNKQLYRNGAAVAEPYAKHASAYIDSYRDNFPSTPGMRLPAVAAEMLLDHVQAGEVVVPRGKYFVLGDNRDDSSDSRYWGFISNSDIIGRSLMVWPGK